MQTTNAIAKIDIPVIYTTEADNLETTFQTVEVEVLPPIDISDKRKIEIYKGISEIDEKLSIISSRVDELNSEIDNLTNHADGIDYTIAVASGILTGLIDSFFVGELGLFENASDEAKAEFREAKNQSNEFVNKFIEKYAKMRGYDPKEGNGSLKGAIEFLEKKFPVAQDNTWKGQSVSSSKTHHLDDLAHHPTLMGLVSSILVQFFRISLFASSDGKIHPRIVETSMKDLSCWIPVVISGVLKWLGYMAEKKDLLDIDNDLPESMQWIIKNIHKIPIILQLAKTADTWFSHLVSDMGGSKNTAGGGAGIPGIFISLLKELSMLPGLKDTAFPKIVNDLYATKKNTTDKIDLRTEIAIVKKQALPVVLNEVIVRIFYFIRRFVSEYREKKTLSEIDWRSVIPFGNRTVERMMTIASGTFVAVDVADAAIRSGGFNPTCILRINFVGIGRFAIAIGTDLAMGAKKIKKERERSDLISEYINWANIKIYYRKADLLCTEGELYNKEANMLTAEREVWQEVQYNTETMKQLYNQILATCQYHLKVINEMDGHLNDIELLLPNIENANPGLRKKMLERLK